MLRCFFLNQMADPLAEAPREGVSNACDSHARSGVLERPVYVTLAKSKLKIVDLGKGLPFPAIRLLNGPGRTSNPGAIFSLIQGEKSVAARNLRANLDKVVMKKRQFELFLKKL